MEGKPLQILMPHGDSLKLNDEALESILLNENIRDKKVVIIAISGEMRRGKSFMLNFFLRYLEAEDKNNWLGDEDYELKGFSWRAGNACNTNGILLWSKPYLIKNSRGEEYAVLLMDTQGTFDNQSSMKKNTMIFAMSTLVSSMLIFNINHVIHEHQLAFLNLFVNYGKLATDVNANNDEKPFQHLQFLLRDWQCVWEYPYGFEGGNEYLKHIMKLNRETQTDEIYNLRKYIKDYFEKIDCCLFPHPGKNVTTSKDFVGKLSDIDSEFIDYLKLYVPSVLSPKTMLPKSINGVDITAMELLVYFRSYFNVFSGDELPSANNIYMASIAACNLATLNKCKYFYKEEMSKIVNNESKRMKPEVLQSNHKRISLKTIDKFKNSRKLGESEHQNDYISQLEKDLEDLVAEFVNLNAAKENNIKAMRTVFVLFVLYIGLYLCQGIVSLVGLSSVSDALGMVMYLLLTATLIWLGSVFLNREDVRDKIEDTMEIIYLEVMCPVARSMVGYATESVSSQVTSRVLLGGNTQSR